MSKYEVSLKPLFGQAEGDSIEVEAGYLDTDSHPGFFAFCKSAVGSAPLLVVPCSSVERIKLLEAVPA